MAVILLDAHEKLREEQARSEKYTVEEQTSAVNQSEATLPDEFTDEITSRWCTNGAEYTKTQIKMSNEDIVVLWEETLIQLDR